MAAGEDQERFAEAVERGLDAVPPGFSEDEELLRELELVALLRQSGPAMGPTADESARMRAKVMAAAAGMMSSGAPSDVRDAEHDSDYDTVPGADMPTVVGLPLVSGVDADARTELTEVVPVAEDESDHDEEATNVVSLGRVRRGRHRFPSQPPSRQHRGLLSISAAAAVMAIAVTGGGAMFSQAALPGDSLYGIKQTTESAMVGLTPGAGNKAQRQLDFASTRIDEVQKVSAASTPPADKTQDINQALKGFNDLAEGGSKAWMTSASSGSSADNSAQLSQLSSWAQQQNQKLASMRASMPADAQPDVDHSMRMLEDMRTRAQSLNNRQGCDHVTTGQSDELGPIPAKGPCKITAVAKEPTSHTATSSGGSKSSTPSEESSSSSPSSQDFQSSSSDKHSSSSHNSDKDSSTSELPDVTGDSDSQPSDSLLPPQKADKAPQGGLLGGLLNGLKPKPAN